MGNCETLVVKSGGSGALTEWRCEFDRLAPELDVRDWDDPDVDPDAVSYALVWQPSPGRLAAFRHLRLIISAVAGVDHILADPDLPKHVPIMRMVTPETAERMADFVAMAALALIRQLPELMSAQRDGQWLAGLTGRIAADTTVGIMGLGRLGLHAALRLRAVGFRVAGWSRGRKIVQGVTTYAGPEDLPRFLAESQVLVNLLPDTSETAGIMNSKTIALLPAGASLINVGRGSHIVENALLDALDTHRLSNAIIDVHDVEPLAPSHAFWHHPRIIMTPHIASIASRASRAQLAASAIRAVREGKPVPFLFEPKRGY
jgi:glyoxylate/hydroxypyruvate reductase